MRKRAKRAKMSDPIEDEGMATVWLYRWGWKRPMAAGEQYHNALRTVTVVIMDLYKHLNVPGRKCGIDIVRRGAEYSCRLRVTCEVALWLLAY